MITVIVEGFSETLIEGFFGADCDTRDLGECLVGVGEFADDTRLDTLLGRAHTWGVDIVGLD